MKKKNKKKFFKSRLQMIIYLLVFTICIILFILIGKTDFRKNEDTEAKKFNSLYSIVDDDNLYIFTNATTVLNKLNASSAIIFLGFPSNEWSYYYAKILNEVAKEYTVDKIYYYDFLQDRKESNGTYQTILNKLSSYVPVNDEGVKYFHAPTIIIVKNGEVIAYFDELQNSNGVISGIDHFNDNYIETLKSKLRVSISKYLEE